MTTIESVELLKYIDAENQNISAYVKFSDLDFKYFTRVSNYETNPVRKQLRIDIDAGVYGPIAPYGTGQIVTPQEI